MTNQEKSDEKAPKAKSPSWAKSAADFLAASEKGESTTAAGEKLRDELMDEPETAEYTHDQKMAAVLEALGPEAYNEFVHGAGI